MKAKNKNKKSIIRIYNEEEIKTINYILNKPENNKIFTLFELKSINKIDLHDKKMVDICKIIFENKDNYEIVKRFLKQINIDIAKT